MQREKLRRNWQILVENGIFSNFQDQLIQDGILTPNEVKTVESQGPLRRQMRKLLSIIEEKQEEDVGKFFTILQVADECLFSQLVSPVPGSSRQPDKFEIVQTELKKWYLDNMKRIQPLPMCEWEEQDLEHVFTNLQVVQGRKRRHSGSSKEQGNKPTNDPDILDRIFKVTPSERNICFIEGPAGIGKSTLCRQFAYLWSKDAYKIHGHHFDLVGILEARSLTKDFRKSFVQELFPEDFQIPEDKIHQHFQTGKSLLIIDGVDELTADGEWAITQLLKGRFFRDVHLIITGRPESVRKFLPYAKLHLEVKGFSVRNAREYICKYYRNDENNYKMKLLDRLRHDRELRELMVNPFVTLLLCILVQGKSGGIPSNVSEIYHEIMWTICRKYVRKFQEQGDCSLDEEMLYNAACYVAYTGVRGDVFVFLENDLNSLCEGDLGFHLLKSGILSKDYTISRLHSNEFCYFPHRSFQEFFCGTYLEKLDLVEFKKEVLPLLRYSPAWPFKHPVLECLRYLGSTQVNKTKIVLEHLFEIVAHDKPESIDEIYCRWIYTLLYYLSKGNPQLDLVDFFRIHFNRWFKVVWVFLTSFNLLFLDELLDDQIHLAICKMDLPPVTYFKDASKSDISDNEMKLSFAMDTYVMMNSRYFQTNRRLLEHFTKSNGVKMPFIHCDDIKHASTCLENVRRLGVLAITLAPHQLNCTDLQAFQQDLTSVENKINIVFVFLEARYDDSRFLNFISLVKGYSSDKVKIQVITLKPSDTEEGVDHFARVLCYIDSEDSDREDSDSEDYDSEDSDSEGYDSGIYASTEYRLSRTLHSEYYHRFCPY